MGKLIIGFLVTALAGGFIFSSVRNNRNTEPVQISNSGSEKTFSVEIDGESREYILHIPPTYSAENQTPLVLFYHGGGGDMNQAKSYLMQDKADKEGFAVAFLNGASRFPNNKLASWNAGNCCAYARDSESDDVSFTKAVIADIKEHMTIDPARIYATGMSNGGMMSYRLACEMSDTFAAVAAVAGTDNTATCDPSRSIPILHIHAQNDTHVLYNGGAGAEAFANKDELVTQFISVPDTIDKWLAYNDMAVAKPVRTLEVPGAYCDTYGTGTTTIRLCVTEEGEHSWPGGTSGGSRDKNPSQAINANDVIWDFFKEQSL